MATTGFRVTLILALASLVAPLALTQNAQARPAKAHPPVKVHPKTSGQQFDMVIQSRGRLGAKVITMSSDLRGFFGAPHDAGLLVDSVIAGSPAAKAGLQSGDVITAVSGKKISETWDISQSLASFNSGDTVTLTVIRNKKERALKATLASQSRSVKSPWFKMHESPFEFDFDATKPFHAPFGKDFPFNRGSSELEDKIRRLEQRLDKLEGNKPGKTFKSPPKPPSKTKPKI